MYVLEGVIVVVLVLLTKTAGFHAFGTTFDGLEMGGFTSDHVVQMRKNQKGLIDYKTLRHLVDVRSRLYDETIRMSNILPGQTQTVHVKSRHRNRLNELSIKSWSCPSCSLDDIEPIFSDASVEDTLSAESDSDLGSDVPNSLYNAEFIPSINCSSDTNISKPSIVDMDNSSYWGSINSEEFVKVVFELEVDNENTTEELSADQNIITDAVIFSEYQEIFKTELEADEADIIVGGGDCSNAREDESCNQRGDVPSTIDGAPSYDRALDEQESMNQSTYETPNDQILEITTADSDDEVDINSSAEKLPANESELAELPSEESTFSSWRTSLLAQSSNDSDNDVSTEGLLFLDVENDGSGFNGDFDVNSLVMVDKIDYDTVCGAECGSSESDFIAVKNDASIVQESDEKGESVHLIDLVSVDFLEDTENDSAQFRKRRTIVEESASILDVGIVTDSGSSSSITMDEGKQIKTASTSVEVDSGVTVVTRALRLQLLVGLLVLHFVVWGFFFRLLYRHLLIYPRNLVVWLDEECHRLFSLGDFSDATRMLLGYLPLVQWLFGPNDVETIACLHYLARAQMATQDFPSSRSTLERLLSVSSIYGEDSYLASVYEDLGFVQHALNDFSGAANSLHAALRILSEDIACDEFVKRGAEDETSFLGMDDDTVIHSKDHCSPVFVSPNRSDSSPLHHRIDAKNDHNTDVSACTTSPTSQLLHSFGSPSTLDLNEALFAHTDLTTAVKELESLLDDGDLSLQSEAQRPRPSLEVEYFSDFINAPRPEIARLCKKLGEVYLDHEDYSQAYCFLQNAKIVLEKLEEMEEDDNQSFQYSQTSAALQESIQVAQQHLRDPTLSREQANFEADMYRRFHFRSPQ